jgi:hypothetical protein
MRFPNSSLPGQNVPTSASCPTRPLGTFDKAHIRAIHPALYGDRGPGSEIPEELNKAILDADPRSTPHLGILRRSLEHREIGAGISLGDFNKRTLQAVDDGVRIDVERVSRPIDQRTVPNVRCGDFGFGAVSVSVPNLQRTRSTAQCERAFAVGSRCGRATDGAGTVDLGADGVVWRHGQLLAEHHNGSDHATLAASAGRSTTGWPIARLGRPGRRRWRSRYRT